MLHGKAEGLLFPTCFVGGMVYAYSYNEGVQDYDER